MKKNIWLLGCLCFFAAGVSSARADDSSPTGLAAPRLGIEGGLDLANFNGQNGNDAPGTGAGFVGGGFLELPLGPGFSLRPELLFEQKDGALNANPFQRDYLEVPVLLDITLVSPLSLLLGPSLDGNLYNSGLNAGGANNFNNGDLGLVGGAQMNFASFLVSGRYEWEVVNRNSASGFQNGTLIFLVGLTLL